MLATCNLFSRIISDGSCAIMPSFYWFGNQCRTPSTVTQLSTIIWWAGICFSSEEWFCCIRTLIFTWCCTLNSSLLEAREKIWEGDTLEVKLTRKTLQQEQSDSILSETTLLKCRNQLNFCKNRKRFLFSYKGMRVRFMVVGTLDSRSNYMHACPGSQSCLWAIAEAQFLLSISSVTPLHCWLIYFIYGNLCSQRYTKFDFCLC